jgi:hypothetical protein
VNSHGPKCELPVRGRLDGVQLGVGTMVCHQIFVSACFDESGTVQNDNQVGHVNPGEAVLYQDGGRLLPFL